jgi:pilus assembly protein FimV
MRALSLSSMNTSKPKSRATACGSWQARALAATLAGIGLGFASPAAQALGLGAASTQSRVGGSLRIEIPIQSGDAEAIDIQCIHLSPGSATHTDDLPWLSKAQISLETRNGKPLLVVSTASNSQPVLMLGVQVRCGTELRRDYTVLLGPPVQYETTLQAPMPPATTHQAEPGNAQTPKTALPPSYIVTLEGDSARKIANRLYPDSVSTQRRMARAILVANAAQLGEAPRGTLDNITPGLELIVPPLTAALPAPEQTTAERIPAPPSPDRRNTRPATEPLARNRLILNGEADTSALRLSSTLSHGRELDETQRERLRTEMQLLATLDEKIATQVELSERLRQLEALQNHLRADAERLEMELKSSQAKLQSAPAAQPGPGLPDPAPTRKPIETFRFPNIPSWIWLTAGLALLGSLLGNIFWRRRQNTAPENLPLDAMGVTNNDSDFVDHSIEPLSEADIWPDEKGHAPRSQPASTSVDGTLSILTASGLGPHSVLQIVDGDIEEHDSAVELADIMMSFGRIQGAAQTLSDFIRANPNQAVKPWIKLLEVYRAANMQTEYEALSAQLNKTFNVRPAAWDEFEIARQAPDTLESMPHILTQLIECWGRRECQVFLHGLLRDNRQGTRQGFPLAIIDEILMLLGILERQIGPYRPDTSDTNTLKQTQRAATQAPTFPAALSVPPIITDETLARSLVLEDIKAAHALPVLPAELSLDAIGSHQLDFDLDMGDMSKTLHIDLDRLTDIHGPGEKQG